MTEMDKLYHYLQSKGYSDDEAAEMANDFCSFFYQEMGNSGDLIRQDVEQKRAAEEE